ncbi:hypothetical protein GK047_06600 [Paenibacillus sp. SYP-B3998]|uniref:Uncharacterized protein n=1 Tax=Paenibacillus sp. SYP-B3998 TaxID=2678564 RepID=A0A6G3ZUE8_9BACL|nr:hypothetical protein [Paenibacillus sp. SYP-B3998]NEW05690.1 hypothetical protein [Paenibacillus sp. SYP-B3998]
MNRVARVLFIGMSILLAALLFGCEKKTEVTDGNKPLPEAVTKASQSPFRIIKDAKGEVQIPTNPKRIVDISGSTEELLVLGYTPIASGNTDMADAKKFTPILKDKLVTNTVNTGWYAS